MDRRNKQRIGRRIRDSQTQCVYAVDGQKEHLNGETQYVAGIDETDGIDGQTQWADRRTDRQADRAVKSSLLLGKRMIV